MKYEWGWKDQTENTIMQSPIPVATAIFLNTVEKKKKITFDKEKLKCWNKFALNIAINI